MDSHIAYDVKLGHDLRDANNTAYSQAFWLLMSCMVATLVVSGGLGLQLYRSITSGLNFERRVRIVDPLVRFGTPQRQKPWPKGLIAENAADQ
jgi:hypothetical protein